LNTNTAPDLLFNDNFRLALVQQSSGKLQSAQGIYDSLDEATRGAISPVALEASRIDGTLMMLPLQLATAGMGVRTSWLKAVGETYPKTWDDVFRVGLKFANDDPDGNGQNDTFGLALQAGDPSVTHQMLELFGFGAGLKNLIIDSDGNVVIDQERNAKLIRTFLSLFAKPGLMSPETRTHTFTDMYQLIEGGRVGIFRVGDWNVAKWNGIEGLGGDFTLGPIPTLFEGEPPALEMHSVRSVVVTPSSAHPDVAAEFAKFMVTPEAQAILFIKQGSAVRRDIPLAGLSKEQIFFASPTYPVNPNDFITSRFIWYPEFQQTLYQLLSDAMANPPADFDAWLSAAADKLRERVAQLKKS
jgi:ABC-type glycerol-3-phosphate transport system substrate-binding protein